MKIDIGLGEPAQMLRVATYNIHKGVQGLGPARRLEIHNLALAIGALDADIVCLQEVRATNRREAEYFTRWPELPQAEYLAPEGYEAVYQTNATTRHGEHGNALLSRWPIIRHWHEDMSDHRFEQRGLRLRRRAVDFIRQHHVSEDRPFHKGEVPPLVGILEDFDAGDVRGHQVGRELDALGIEAERDAERVDQLGLGKAGDADQERMSAGKDRHQRVFDDAVLAENDGGNRLLGRADLP